MNSGQQTLESMSQAVWYNQWTLKKFVSYLRGDILEVGCGIGNFTKSLTKYGTVWAIDIKDEYLNQTRKVVGGTAKVGFGDIERDEYFFKDQKFDCVVCLNVLEHIKDDEKALQNLFNLLNEGGSLILLVPAHGFLYGEIDKSIGHFRRYNREVLIKELNKTGFKIAKNRIINMLGAIGWWIFAKLFSNSKVDQGKINIFNMIAPLILPLEDIVEPPFGISILIIAQKTNI